jgi:hypothetical protein
VLERSELRDLFSEGAGWELVRDEIVLDTDHGRTLVQFIARKKRESDRVGCYFIGCE